MAPSYKVLFLALLIPVLVEERKTEILYICSVSCITKGLLEILSFVLYSLFLLFYRYFKNKRNRKLFSDVDWNHLHVKNFILLFVGGAQYYFSKFHISDDGIITKHLYELFIALLFAAVLSVLVVGNESNTSDVETGPGIDLAFHYFLRLKNILEKIKYESLQHLFSNKLFIILPLKYHWRHRLKEQGKIPIENTTYSVKTYKIDQWVVMLDFPSELTTIHKMALNNKFPGLDEEKQVRLFYCKLKELLKASNLAYENQTQWELIAFDYDKLESTSDGRQQESVLERFLKNIVLPCYVSGSSNACGSSNVG